MFNRLYEYLKNLVLMKELYVRYFDEYESYCPEYGDVYDQKNM